MTASGEEDQAEGEERETGRRRKVTKTRIKEKKENKGRNGKQCRKQWRRAAARMIETKDEHIAYKYDRGNSFYII